MSEVERFVGVHAQDCHLSRQSHSQDVLHVEATVLRAQGAPFALARGKVHYEGQVVSLMIETVQISG